MRKSSATALKEWAVICAALGEGRQSLIVRKGGIHEGSGGFRPEHGEFWLFPTYEHQQAERLIAAARPLLARTEANRPAHDLVRISIYVVVEDIAEVRDPRLLANLAGMHIWSDHTLEERFRYRTPGLYVLTVRAYRLDAAHELAWSEHFAGCRSWVALPRELSTDGARPVLEDDEFLRRWSAVRLATAPVRLA